MRLDYLSPLQTERSIPWQVVEVKWCDDIKKSGQEKRDAAEMFLECHLRGDRRSIAQGGGGGLFVRDNKKWP